MKKYLGYGLVFTFIYLVFVIAMIPARWAISQIELPKNIAIQGVSGTIWQLKIASLSVNDQKISDINMSVKISSLLLLNPSIDVQFGSALASGPEGKISVDQLFSQIRLFDAQVVLAANEIAQQLDLPIPMKANDFIELSLEQFILGSPVCQSVEGQLRWQKASVSAFEQKVNLGTLTAELGCKEGEFEVVVSPQNDLGLEFTAYIGQGNRLYGQGYLRPGANFPEPLKQVLPFMGRKDNQGRYLLRM